MASCISRGVLSAASSSEGHGSATSLWLAPPLYLPLSNLFRSCTSKEYVFRAMHIGRRFIERENGIQPGNMSRRLLPPESQHLFVL